MAYNLFTDDLTRAINDELFAAIEGFAKSQPSEGWRHDYTVIWGDSALEKTAAFANTFGGVIIVGVSKQQRDLTCKVNGVDSQTELKTAIANSIAANLSPTPAYEVFECHAPLQPGKRFCIVRIRSSGTIHLITKKGLKPVYVRNEDEALPADAAQLRRLIDRERAMHVEPARATQLAGYLANGKRVNRGYQAKDLPTWVDSPHSVSDTCLQMALAPTEVFDLELDRQHELLFSRFVAEIYPQTIEAVRQNSANQTESRHARSYEYIWYEKSWDYESRWMITSEGCVVTGAEMRLSEAGSDKLVWSVVDLAAYIVGFLKLSMRWWQQIGYFGDGHLAVHLILPRLALFRAKDGTFKSGIDLTYQATARNKPRSIDAAAIVATPTTRDMASANMKVNYFSATSGRAQTTTSVLNILLRCLGHAAVWNLLEQNVRLLSEE